MHEKAKERMRQLIRAWLDEVVLVGDTVDFGFVHSQTGDAIETLLFKQFGQWLDSYPRTSIAILIFDELKRSNLLQAAGAGQARLADTQSADTLDRLADTISNWWDTVPRKYRWTFATPGIVLPPACVISISPNISLSHVERTYNVNDNPAFSYGNLLSGLGSILNPPQKTVDEAELSIETEGAIVHTWESLPAAAQALRILKQFLRLALVANFFKLDREDASTVGTAACRDVTDGVSLPPLTVPAALGSRLAKLRLGEQFAISNIPTGALGQGARAARIDSLTEQLNKLGNVITFASLTSPEEERKDSEKKKAKATDDDHRNSHCSRIVTAAEWLFDSETESAKAMGYVQLAVAFEALCGGGKEEPVVETIANRVAYSIGKTSGDRVHLIRQFRAFYDKRSGIVHNGSTRLSREEMQLYYWARQTLQRLLISEMEVAAPSKASILASALRALPAP